MTYDQLNILRDQICLLEFGCRYWDNEIDGMLAHLFSIGRCFPFDDRVTDLWADVN